MFYNPSDRSELELRFERLFEQCFGCPVEDVLIPQYRVETNGRVYRIDYAYVSDTDRIAIELHGHGKIKGSAESSQEFQKLLSRQNDIVQAGFTVYCFTWGDVVHRHGWKARKALHQIFKGRLKARNYLLNWLVPRSHNPQANSNLPYIDPPPPMVEAQVVNSKEWHPVSGSEGNQPLSYWQWYWALTLVGGLLLLYFIRSEPAPPSPTIETTSAHSQSVQPQELLMEGLSSSPSPAPQSQVITRTVYIQPKPVAPESSQSPAPIVHPIQEPPKPVTPEPAIVPPSPVPSPAKEVPSPAPKALEPDEIVAFNKESKIFHNPSSYWAKKCTQNCIYIPKSQAIQMGGRASRSSGPYGQ